MSFHTGTSISDLFISVLDPFHHLYTNSVWIRPRWLMHKACVKHPHRITVDLRPCRSVWILIALKLDMATQSASPKCLNRGSACVDLTCITHVSGCPWCAACRFSICKSANQRRNRGLSTINHEEPSQFSSNRTIMSQLMSHKMNWYNLGPGWQAATIRQSTNCSPFVLFEWTWMTPVCKLGTLYMAHKALHMQRCSNRIANLNSPTLQWWQSLLFISSHGCLSGMCGIHVAWAPVAKQIYLVT